MGRRKKEEEKPPEGPITYMILDYEHLKNRDKDLLHDFFHRMKHIPNVNDEEKIKEMLHYLDLFGYALCKKPK